MKVIITGSSGMVGKAVLLESLDHPSVTEIAIINRSPSDIVNPKLKEVLLKDFSDFTAIQDALKGYDACFHCMGVSAVGMSDEKYMELTFGITKSLADVLFENNPKMIFIYVSGTGTDSSENGRVMWAIVKGKTENYILNKGFKDAYAFRPGIILPEKNIKSKIGWYNTIYVITKPLFPIFKKFQSVTTTTKLGRAMLNSVLHPQNKKHLENTDINLLAKK